MRKIQLSVIIPAYNAANSIETLIRSFDFQKSDPAEILVIENGSTDRTAEIVSKLAEELPFVRLLHSEKGISNARNKGLDHASGDWVVFADADDQMLPDAKNILLHDLRVGYDFILYGYHAGQKIKSVNDADGNQYRGKQACRLARQRMLENPTLYMTVWGKLFSNKIIQEHQIRFNPEIRFSEDGDFNIKYCHYCEAILFSQHMIYQYNLNPASVMRTFQGDKSAQYLAAMQMTQDSIKGEPEALQNAFWIYVLMHFNIAMVREVFATANPADWEKKISSMKSLSEETIFREAFSAVPLQSCRNARMMPIILMKLHCYQLAGLLFRTKARLNDRQERKK